MTAKMMAAKTPAVQFSMSDDGAGQILLSRPYVANALDWNAINDLAAAAEEARKSPARAVFIRGEGKHFCAGADAKWLAAKTTRREGTKQARLFADTLRVLYQMPKPVIALVQGACYGGGIGLAAAADICFADASAKFCFGEVRLGLIPAVIAPFVAAAIGLRSARRYVVGGEVMDAKAAARIGLAHEVVDDLARAKDAMVKQLRQNAPGAMAKAKALLREINGRAITPALSAKTAEILAATSASSDAREGLNAFLQKRKPKWDDDNV